jgi:hypothetical protein
LSSHRADRRAIAPRQENDSGSAEDDIQKQDHVGEIAEIKGEILAAAPIEQM